ncbi:MAG: hypothetical protein WA039_07010, partial [Gemmiger qucibialis]
MREQGQFVGKNRNADRVTTGKSEKNLNGFPQTEGLLVENKNARRGDRMLMTVYHGCSSVCGTMQASRPTNLYNKSGALPISSAPLNFVLCSFIAPGAP